MGTFSFMTSDTKKSVSSVDSDRGALPCKMILPDGMEYIETEYEGYGMFHDEDFFVHVAILNGGDPKCLDDDDLFDDAREDGIQIYFAAEDNNFNTKAIILPKIVSIDFSGKYDDVPDSPSCPHQGFFYDNP